MMKEVIKHIDELTNRIKEMDDLIDEYMIEYEKKQKSSNKNKRELYYSSISRDGWNGFLKNGNLAETFNLLQTCEEVSSEYKKEITDFKR